MHAGTFATGARTRLGGYEVVRTLAHGGMARIDLALAEGPGGAPELVVLKRLRAAMLDDEDARAMLAEEALLAARMLHPNVVLVHDLETIGHELVLSMEFLDGESLRDVTRACEAQGRKVPLPIAIHVVCEALAGLAYAHALRDHDGTPLGIVHRDVSPHNVIVTYAGAVKVIDFGIAKATEKVDRTQSGMIKGKLGYMAPEQAAGEAVDRRADLFAMGVVLWELVAGVRFSRATTVGAAVYERLNLPLPRLSDVVADVPRALEQVIDRALARTKGDRFQSADEMRQALLAYAREAGQTATRDDVARFVTLLFGGAAATFDSLPPPPPIVTPPPPAPPLRTRAAVIATTLLCLATVIATLVLVR